MFSGVFNTNSILDDSLFKIQSDIIRQLAKKILQYLLEGVPTMF
jgi:hypothetical protein